jgi:ketosteroid isomerase-like protein
MKGSRIILAVMVVMTMLLSRPALGDEAAVRLASQAIVDAWNRHEPAAWSAHLAEDVWYSDVDDSLYERFKGRDKAVGQASNKVETSDLQWDMVRMKTLPSGVVSVVLVQRVSLLPKTDGQYRAVFVSDPALARWRRDADGRWRLVFFTSHKGWALAEIRKDDTGHAVAASAPPAASSMGATADAAAPRGTATGGPPKEYTRFWGRFAHNCNYCHGRPPVLPTSRNASQIVPVGAATSDGAGLRAAMQRKDLREFMAGVLADPELTDAALEVVRRYLVDVRDGALPDHVSFATPGAVRELTFRNERSSRDEPVTIALMKVSGPFALDPSRSTCRQGATLAGETACTVTLRASPDAAPSSSGALDLKLAPTPGLQPQVRRTILRLGG